MFNMRQNLDLSKKAHSMTAILESHTKAIMACATKEALITEVANLFKANKLDTPASRRLLLNMSKERSLEGAQFTVYNSILAGSGNGVI